MNTDTTPAATPTTAAATAPAPGAGAPGGVVGVLGGMGPLATVDFLHKLLQATPARRDQDHVPLLAASLPQIPDRTAAFRGEGESPLPAMLDSGRRLAAGGAGLVVVPCNTAHLWFDELQAGLGLPMLHVVDAALAEVRALAPRLAAGGALRVGLLATDATLASGLYLNRRPARGPADADAPAAIQWLLPTAVEMVERLMPGIEAVKAGDLAEGGRQLKAAAAALARRGAQVLVLACTEVPLVLGERDAGLPVVDATAALARAAVAWSRGQPRPPRQPQQPQQPQPRPLARPAKA